MSISAKDRAVLRELVERYSEIAHLDVQQERIDRYKRTVALEQVRPVVLINEIPWGEIKNDALVSRCEDKSLRGIEGMMRRALYQWDHFQVDTVVPAVHYVGKASRSTGIGISTQDIQIHGDTGAYISAHEYVDQLQTEEDIEKIKMPEITANPEGTAQSVARAEEVFEGLIEVEVVGHAMQYNMWDQIAQLRGVESLLMDLAMRPEFMHRICRKLTDVAVSRFKQCEELDLLGYGHTLLHCTVAATDELPADDHKGKVRPKDVWGRCAAQIFASVSPEMHDEFDLAYNQEMFGDCGLVYYGCCEPMDTKIDILRKRFKNLRKVSITPWADPEVAAEQMGSDLVMAAKPNPAFVASPTFDPKPVEDEIVGYLEACKRYSTPCEFVLKDISTIANNPDNLTKWAETVSGVIDRYYR